MAIKISGSTIIDDSRNIVSAGVVTATSFSGDGSALTNVGLYADTDLNIFSANTCSGCNLDGTNGCFNVFLGACAGKSTDEGYGNVFIGKCAGRDNTTGLSNNFIGFFAGRNNIGGSNNNFFGSYAGLSNETGIHNIFIGQNAGRLSESANYNTFLGFEAGCSNTSGVSNIAIGPQAGKSNTIGCSNNFIGRCAGRTNTEGYENNFLGFCAGFSNTTGSRNVFIGRCVGAANTTGSDNIFLGHDAGRGNTSGGNNTFIGRYAGRLNISGDNNTFLNQNAGLNNTTGNKNNFIGMNAGVGNTTGSCNNMIGVGAGQCATVTGQHNTFLGTYAGKCASGIGQDNNFFGRNTGLNNTTGNSNNFFGINAGIGNTTGNNNNFIGPGAGQCATVTGQHNTFLGTYAGKCASGAGNYNNFIGPNVGFHNTTGNYNNFIGYSAGCLNTIGSTNIYVGMFAGLCGTEASRNVFIGQYAGIGNTTGCCNNMIGRGAGQCATVTGQHNTFIGTNAGKCASGSGTLNNFIGCAAGESNTSGVANNFFGYLSGCSNTTGNNNVIIGRAAGRDNISGNDNNFIGRYAGLGNTIGNYNNYIGSGAGRCNTTGCCNTFIGARAGESITSSSWNIIIGDCAGRCSTTTGVHNIYFGQAAGERSSSDGSYNIFQGYYSGYCNTSGDSNVFLGNSAGRNATSGANNIFLGKGAGDAVTTGSNNVIIGDIAGTTSLANTIIMGDGAGNERLRITSAGLVGIGTNNPTKNLTITGNNPGILIKEDSANSELSLAVSDSDGTGVIAATRPSNYTYEQLAIRGQDLIFETTSTASRVERLRITSTGLVGIGTDNPDAKLHVYQSDSSGYNAISDQRSEAEIRITNPLETEGTFSSINFYNGGGVGGDISLNAVKSGTDYISHFTIKQRSGGGSTDWRERFRIHSDGNVGIGTDSPGTLLELKGQSSKEATVTFNRQPVQSTNNGVIGELMFENATDSVALLSVKRESAADDAYFQFATQAASGGLTERLRITSAGKLSVSGSTANMEYLRMGGNNDRGLRFTSSSGSSSVGVVHTINAPGDNGAQGEIVLQTNSAERLRIASNGRITHIGKNGAAANPSIDPYASFVLNDVEARLQLCATNSGSSAAGLILSNQSKHFVIHQRGPDHSNRLDFGYLSNASPTDINGQSTSYLSITTAGSLQVKGDTNPNAVFDRGSANTTNVNFNYNGTLTGQLGAANSEFQISAAGSNTPLTFFTNGSERLRIHSDGSIYAGGSPISESDLNWGHDTYQRPFIIAGQTGGNPSDGALVLASPETNPSNTRIGLIAFGSKTSSTAGVSNSGLKSFISGHTNTNVTDAWKTGGYLSFSTRPDNGNLTERMRIDSAGLQTITASNNSTAVQIRDANNYAGQLITSTDGTFEINARTTTKFTRTGSNTESMRIADDGKIGIGTANPATMLEVGNQSKTLAGAITVSNGEIIGGGTGPIINLKHGPVGGIQRTHSIYSYTGDLRIAADSNENMEFHTGGSESLRITSDGQVNLLGGILNLGTADSSSGHINAFENMSFNIDTDNDDTNRYFSFHKNSSSASGTELVRITESGKIGIGTDNPTTNLQVNDASNEATISLFNAGTKKAALQASNSFGTIIYSYDSEPLLFSVHSGSSFSEKMRITSGGRLGIGLTNPESYYSSGNDLVVGGTGSHGISIKSGATNQGILAFAKGTSGASEQYAGYVLYNHGISDVEHMQFAVGATERLRIGSSGQIGLSGANYGTSGQVLTSNGDSSAPTWQDGGGGLTPDSQENLYAGGGAGAASDADTCFNIALGCNALNDVNSGDSNIALGVAAGAKTTSGGYNIFTGQSAGYCNTNGQSNIFLGYEAGKCKMGCMNIAIGKESGKGCDNATGVNNITLGVSSGFCLGSANHNIFLGTCAGRCQASGNTNIMIGYHAGLHHNDANSKNNVFIGRDVALCSSGGCCNNFLGMETGYCNTTGYENNFIGNRAGKCNTTGYGNNFIGHYAGFKNTEGQHSIFLGTFAGMCNTTGDCNNFIGNCAGKRNTTGGDNNFIGNGAGMGNTSGNSNTMIGTAAGFCSDTGFSNIFLGEIAGRNTNSGNYNIFIGRCSGNTNTSGSCNIAIGCDVELPSATGSNQFAIGRGTSRWISGDSSFNVNIPNTLSKGGGSFKINHPHPTKKDTHFLVHSFIEGPKIDLIYRGRVNLVAGTATINIDEVSNMTEGTFVLLNRDIQSFTTNETGWSAVKSSVSDNLLTIIAQDSESTDTISWMVIGERHDDTVQSLSMTDDDGNLIVEPLKDI